ncbi:hypothetical protein ACV2XU_21720 [Klebsiella pneumoniae]|uniref:hypothetical protein n=2 Tax=Klebsiella pneumoniae TaxID=573 RepID=UPI000342242D|nr:hypothetical protein [Klebsiella pneumoniae]EOY63970.1 hypothetical protein H253_5302 [Klebsiella pneumoniae KP-7]EOZ58870.1 hypothetical protein H254_5347 [Klebsiella pneumoniae KP-11]MBC4304966.1 hypothetical protein [Klebsiella pneumoniae]MBG1840708.1 hypothetical protein [Klebsiella pneumoniae]MCC4917557.1 hypothetical protein [Klebsiella pneumoniae]
MTILIQDSLRRAVEAASRGAQTVLYTRSGDPSFVNIIPKFDVSTIDASLGSGTHPAFIVNGTEVSQIFVGTYPGCIVNGQLLSLPDRIPATSVAYDTGIGLARAAGIGWHAMTNAEWAAIALLCYAQGQSPRGNTNWGLSSDNPSEKGRRADGLAAGTESGTGLTLTGSGPVSWRHNRDYAGIADLAGNIWETVTGVRFCGGELQIMVNNDAALYTTDHTLSSTAWKAVSGVDGSLLTPTGTGTPGTDSYVPTTPNSVRIGLSGTGNYTLIYGENTLFTSATNPGATPVSDVALRVLRRLMLFPLPGLISDDSLSYKAGGEVMTLRGGAYTNGAGGGINALLANRGRTSVGAGNSGVRPVYYKP